MLRSTFILALAAGVLGAAAAPAASQDTPDTRPGVAVFSFVNNSAGPDSEQFDRLGGGLQQMLTYELAQNTSLRVIDRDILREAMAEQELGASGRVDAETAARIGRIVGAKYIIVGSFMDNPFANNFAMVARIVDVETTELVRTARADGQRADMYRLTVNLGEEITRGVRLPPLPAAVREARAKRPITPDAMLRHSTILSYRDDGETEKAIELYRQLVADFPQVEEWQAELRQLTAG